MRFLLSLTALLSLASCGQQQGSSEMKALVSEEQAQKAFDIVAAIDYVPFEYKPDECYARMLYMAMELAAEGIPSSAHYIMATDEYLWPFEGIAWGWHVAPLLKVGEDEPWILDPSLAAGPIRRSEWIAKTNPLSSYETAIEAGSRYHSGYAIESGDPEMIKNFDEMPAFQAKDIDAACDHMELTLYAYDSSTGGRIRKLIERTRYLLNALDKKGKLTKGHAGGDCKEAFVDVLKS